MRSVAKPCSYLRAKERAKDNYQANRERKLEYEKRRQQTPEYKLSRQEWEEKNPEKILVYRQREKQKHREKTGLQSRRSNLRENAEPTYPIGGIGPNGASPAQHFLLGSALVCDNDIGKRGTSRFCSEDCKQRHQQSKELQVYTKVCTKCNETKEHTEFGWHSNRRRPSCKSCEVKEQSERYYNSTPQQRTRRLRLRRET